MRFRCTTVSVLFSEPKIPQILEKERQGWIVTGFQCSSASRKFLKFFVSAIRFEERSSFSALQRAENSSKKPALCVSSARRRFQCSSASRKFLKIPHGGYLAALVPRFSALQRAENSSNMIERGIPLFFRSFSALQRAENSSNAVIHSCRCDSGSFSALQRAENSSNGQQRTTHSDSERFSALQRAENSSKKYINDRDEALDGFSALQRAENSSKYLLEHECTPSLLFQCSSASRKFLKATGSDPQRSPRTVSVLFSEPKIPQRRGGFRTHRDTRRFQCSSASRKFLKHTRLAPGSAPAREFQCSSASRKFLKPFGVPASTARPRVSVLFSEPKIPQTDCTGATSLTQRFQCSSASRKFLKRHQALVAAHQRKVSVLFSEPKIPQTKHGKGSLPTSSSFSALQRAENSSKPRCRCSRCGC